MDIIAGILYMAGVSGFLFLILHLLEKYGGISTFSTPSQGRSLRNSLKSEKSYVEAVSKGNPELYNQAIISVKNKKYAPTYSNINKEMSKISKNNPGLESPVIKFPSSLSGTVTKSPEEEEIIKVMVKVSEKTKHLEQSIYYTLYRKSEKNSDEQELVLSDNYLKWKNQYDQNYLEFEELMSKYLQASKNGSLKDILNR